MIDIRLIREDQDIVRKNLEKRGSGFPLDELVDVDKRWRESLQEMEKLKAHRNQVTQEIARKKEPQKIKEMKSVVNKIKKLEADVADYKKRWQELMLRMPNILDDSVPVGKAEGDNVEVRKWGEVPKFSFEPRGHVEIGELLGLMDSVRAAKVAGARFYYLRGDLVRLDQAILQYALDSIVRKGYCAIEPPFMMKRAEYEGVTDLGDFENVMYKIHGEDFYLIATSEHAVAAMLSGESIPSRELPQKFVAISPCFRREVGTHGKYTKGLFRMHQFNKVEQFIFCHPRDSQKYFDELQKNAEELYQGLGLHYRVVNVCTGDIGTVAAKKYDIEAWMADGKYREIGSCSNCTDYQARRLNVRYVERGTRGFVHTINNTALASSRTMLAIMEQYQQKDGSFLIPKVLQPYMGGQKAVKKQKC